MTQMQFHLKQPLILSNINLSIGEYYSKLHLTQNYYLLGSAGSKSLRLSYFIIDAEVIVKFAPVLAFGSFA
jgi:hypothetical protein